MSSKRYKRGRLLLVGLLASNGLIPLLLLALLHLPPVSPFPEETDRLVRFVATPQLAGYTKNRQAQFVALRPANTTTKTPAPVIALVPAGVQIGNGGEVIGRPAPQLREDARLAAASVNVPLAAEPLILELPNLGSDDLPHLALMFGIVFLVLAYAGWRSLPELEGERIILRTRSHFFHVLEYGLVAAALGACLVCDAALRRSGVALSWSFMWGTMTYCGIPVALVILLLVAPRLASVFGIGAVADRS